MIFFTFFVIYAILSFISAFMIFKKQQNKLWLLIPIYLTCISLIALRLNDIGIFGLGGLIIIPIMILRKRGKNT